MQRPETRMGAVPATALAHSDVVGGSTAARLLACPGSARLSATVPRPRSSSYADRGTLLHAAAAHCLSLDLASTDCIGMWHADETLTPDLHDEKLAPALGALGVIDPAGEMSIMVETRVGFGDVLPGAFGSCDLLGRLGNRAVVLDWKFGDGVTVEAEENAQLMFYAAAAMRTDSTKWVFDGADEIELVVVQPPETRRWITTPTRLRLFEAELRRAVSRSKDPDAPFAAGSHCRFCPAQPVCPLLTGAARRALAMQLDALDADAIGAALTLVAPLDRWMDSLRKLAIAMLEEDRPVPGWKLVPKRGVRRWADETAAAVALRALLPETEVIERSLVSPAAAERALKKANASLPEGLAVPVSSGSTLAPAADPRAEVSPLARRLTRALAHTA